MQIKEWSYVYVLELSRVPVRPNEGGAQMKWQTRCIIPDCKSEPSTICDGCTQDIQDIVFVCEPSARKQCWEILHQTRSPKLLDAQRNEIERPNLIKKETEQQFRCWAYSEKTTQFSYFESSSHSAGLETLLLHECQWICIIQTDKF